MKYKLYALHGSNFLKFLFVINHRRKTFFKSGFSDFMFIVLFSVIATYITIPSSPLTLLRTRLYNFGFSSLWGWYFFHIDPGHWLIACVGVTRSVSSTVTDPESHAHSALVDFLTHAFDLPYTVQIILGATFYLSIFHVDYTINRCWSRALGSIEGEIPSSAASMAAIEAKNTIPKDTQACYFGLFLENTFLKKLRN